jgi:hypothetical protein
LIPHGGPLDNYGFDGVLDEVQIYNRALSAQEVMDVFTDRWP